MKKLTFWSVISAVLLMVCPVICFNFMDDGILLLVLLLLVQFAYPLLSVVCGIVGGLSIKKLYSLPFINSGMFMLSIWLIYGDPDFLGYAVINLAISLVIMCIVAYVKKKAIQTHYTTNEVEL